MATSTECGQCRRENRLDAAFCAGCGSSLTHRCPACDRELALDARFCDACGQPLADSPNPHTATPRAPENEAVRKTVTVLFGDLVGSTSFGEQVDPELTREAMARYHEMARRTIEANGGTVAKFIGDGVMALFGVPEVSEDDAQRAVSAGIDLQHHFGPIRAHVADRYGAEVGLRVGINTGEVVIAEDDADVVGDALNTAARLEAECTPGSVLVGAATWRLTRSTTTYESLGEFQAKGKREGVAAYRVIDAGEAPEAALEPVDSPFVGRLAELTQLQSTFEAASDDRRTKLATVIGAPGVGKTRLAREFTARARTSEAIVVELRCRRRGTATYAPIADLLRSTTGLTDGTDREEILASLRLLVGDTDDAERITEILAAFLGVGGTRSTEEAFYAVRRLAEIHSAALPLVLVVDDIQWAGPVLFDLLDHLHRWVAGAVTIVALARPELREVRPSLTESGHSGNSVIALEGLDAGDTTELVTQLLGSKPLPDQLRERLPTSTGGNPLFVREFVRMLVEEEVLTESAEGWDVTGDATNLEVPPTIQSLLATRIERLPPDDRRIAELAAVVGTEFPVGAVAAIADDLTRAQIESALERLRRGEQVEPTGRYWSNEPVYRFHHVLIRDAAYRRLLKGRRAELHPQVGAWMETNSHDLVDEVDVATAHHFEQAFHYGVELGLGASNTEIGEKAAGLLRRAAEAALAREDLTTAGRLAERAIDCLERSSDQLSGLLILACEALLSAGDVRRGTPLLEQLTERAQGNPRLEAWAVCFRGQLAVLTEPSQLAEDERSIDVAADRLAVLGDDAGVAKARLVRAAALARLGEVGACEVELDHALAAARAADDRRRIIAVLAAAPVAALWGPSPVERAGGRCLDVMRLSRVTSSSPVVEATAVRCQALLEAFRGNFDTARTLLDSARTMATDVGLRHALLETDLYAGILELLADEPAAAEPYLRNAYAGLDHMRIGADAGQAAAYLALSLLRQGQLDEAEAMSVDSDSLAGQTPQTAIVARSALAETLAVRGDLDDALTIAEEALRVAAPTDIVFDHASALMTLAHVRDAAGDAEGSRRAATAAARLFEEKGATHLSRDARSWAGGVEMEDAAPRTGIEVSSVAAALATGPAARACLDVSFHVGEAITSRDAHAFLCCWSRDLRFVDHRSMGWDAGDYEAMVSRFRSLNPDDAVPTDDVVAEITEVHRVAPPFTCHTGGHVLTTPDGAELVERHIMVSRVHPESGRLDLMEEYPEAALDDAVDRFDALVASDETMVTPNEAVFVGGAASRRALAGHLDTLADFLSDHYVAVHGDPVGRHDDADPDGLAEGIGRQEILTGEAPPRVAGFARRRELVATRGERSAAVMVTDTIDGADRRRYAVDEIDAEGRLQRTTLFSESHRQQALAHLEQVAATAAPS